MICPGCGHQHWRVLESRVADAGDAVRRRRECLSCTERITTYERVELPPLWVRKHDGRTEQFCREKLLRGLGVACSKRSVPLERLEVLATTVESKLRAAGIKDIASSDVGELALDGLVRIDEAAAIRFASVIHRTHSLDGFRSVLDRMETTLDDLGDPRDESPARRPVRAGTRATRQLNHTT